MAIKKVSEETRAAIKRKSAYSLPNRPSEAGMKPDEIKRAFYQPVVDVTLSALGEVDRVVDEINAETAKQNEQFSESVKELKATDEKMKEASEKEIAAHEEEIKRLKEGLQEADNKYVKKVVKESGVSVYTTSEQEPTLALAKGTTTGSVARRYEDGRLRVGDPVEALDAVNKRFAGDNYVGKSGDQTISGRLSVKELYVAGSTYAKDIQSLSVKDAVIVANADGALLSELSGYVIRTGEASAYGVMYDPAADCVKIGLGTFDGENKVFSFDPDEAQPLATRAEIGHGNIPIWDAVKQTLIDSGVTFGGFDGDEFMYQTDDALSLDSIYPVKNKVIAQKIAEMELETDRRFHNAAPELKFIKTVKVWGDFSTKKVYEYAFKKSKDIDLTTDEEGNEVSLREVLLEIKAFASASTQDERLTAKFGFDESSGVKMSDTVVFYARSNAVTDSFIHAHRIIPNLFLIETYSFGGDYDWNADPFEEALSPRTEPGSSSMEDRAIVVNTVVCPRKVTIATESAGGHIVEVNVWGVTEKYTDSDGDAFAKRSIETIMASLSSTLESYVKKTGHGKETTHVLTEDSEGTIGAVPLDEASNAGTAALRKNTGALAVGDPVEALDAVNLRTMNRKTANALIGEKSGGAVVLNDLTPTPNSVKVSVESRNLVPLVYASAARGTSVTISGVTFAVNEDGSITLNGKNDGSDNSSFFIYRSYDDPLVLKKGTYIGNSSKNDAAGLGLNGLIHEGSVYMSFGGTYTIEKDTAFRFIYFGVGKGSTREFNGETFYPMLMRGTELEDYVEPLATGTAATLVCGDTEIPTAIGETVTLSNVAQGSELSIGDGAALYVEYNRDINYAFAELQQAIISLGGNI